MNIEICKLCIEEDFGYCSLRNNSIELCYKHNADGELIKCSGFNPDKGTIKRIFKLEQYYSYTQ